MSIESKTIKFVKEEFIPRLTDNEYKVLFNNMIQKHPELQAEFLETCFDVIKCEATKPIPKNLFDLESDSETNEGYVDMFLARPQDVERYLDGIDYLKRIGKPVIALQRLTGALKYAEFEQPGSDRSARPITPFYSNIQSLTTAINQFDDEIVQVTKMIDPKSMKRKEYYKLMFNTSKEVNQALENLSCFSEIVLRKTGVLMQAITNDLQKKGKVRDGLVGYVNEFKTKAPRKKLYQHRMPKGFYR